MSLDGLVCLHTANVSSRKIPLLLGISELPWEESKSLILERVQVEQGLSLGDHIHEYQPSEVLQHRKAAGPTIQSRGSPVCVFMSPVCPFPSVESVPGFSQPLCFGTAPVITDSSSQEKKCVQRILHFGDILAFSSLADLLMRIRGFISEDTSSSRFMGFYFWFFMSPVPCQYMYFDVKPLCDLV